MAHMNLLKMQGYNQHHYIFTLVTARTRLGLGVNALRLRVLQLWAYGAVGVARLELTNWNVFVKEALGLRSV